MVTTIPQCLLGIQAMLQLYKALVRIQLEYSVQFKGHYTTGKTRPNKSRPRGRRFRV